MGAYDAPYKVGAGGQVLTANLAYKLDVDRLLLDSVTFYNDYSLLLKSAGAFPDSHQNTVGALVHTGPVYAYFDAAVGKHHPWLGGSYSSALAEGNASDPWNARFNANIGYYF